MSKLSSNFLVGISRPYGKKLSEKLSFSNLNFFRQSWLSKLSPNFDNQLGWKKLEKVESSESSIEEKSHG